MIKWIAALLFAMPAQAFEFERLEGGILDLDDLRGRAVLVVNTASLCGFTDQYAGLQTLHEDYGPRGLTVIGVPSDTFRQELGSEGEVADFCEVNYGLTLPLTTITTLRGPNAHPFYRWMADQGAVPHWNFNKALLNEAGQLVAFEGAGTRPTSRPHAPRHRGRASRVTLPSPLFMGSEIYRGSSYGKWHPLRVPRVSTVMDLCSALGWLPPGSFRISPRAKPAALEAWHTPDYIAALQAAEAEGAVSEGVRERHGLGSASNPVFPEMYRRPATGAGASLLAGELLAGGGVIHNPGGGTHHGMPDRAAGFCYLNDAVLGILSLRRGGATRIAYVDIDAHHMDGVEHAFADDPDTLLISTHEEKRWPFTGALDDAGIGQVFNLPLPRGLNDTEFALARDRLILPAVSRFAPDAIVLQCGADAVEEDPLSRLMLSNGAHWAVLRALLEMAPRVLVLGGGGYNPWSVGRLWTGNWAICSGQEIPDRLPAEAEAVLRAIRFDGNSRGRNPREGLFTQLADPPRRGAVRGEVADRVDRLAMRIGTMTGARRMV